MWDIRHEWSDQSWQYIDLYSTTWWLIINSPWQEDLFPSTHAPGLLSQTPSHPLQEPPETHYKCASSFLLEIWVSVPSLEVNLTALCSLLCSTGSIVGIFPNCWAHWLWFWPLGLSSLIAAAKGSKLLRPEPWISGKGGRNTVSKCIELRLRGISWVADECPIWLECRISLEEQR